MKTMFLLLILAMSAAVCPLNATAQCGVERNDVKDLKDAAAKEIHGLADHAAKPMTIAALRKVKPPVKIGNTLPRQDGEKQVYEVEADLIGYKYEADGDRDYHVVLSSPGKPAETMIIEIPHPECGPAEYRKLFADMRAFVDAQAKAQAPRHTAGPTFFQFPKPVAVTASGVTFFDKIHGTHVNLDGTKGQIGVAPNGIELHPALSLKKN